MDRQTDRTRGKKFGAEELCVTVGDSRVLPSTVMRRTTCEFIPEKGMFPRYSSGLERSACFMKQQTQFNVPHASPYRPCNYQHSLVR